MEGKGRLVGSFAAFVILGLMLGWLTIVQWEEFWRWKISPYVSASFNQENGLCVGL